MFSTKLVRPLDIFSGVPRLRRQLLLAQSTVDEVPRLLRTPKLRRPMLYGGLKPGFSVFNFLMSNSYFGAFTAPGGSRRGSTPAVDVVPNVAEILDTPAMPHRAPLPSPPRAPAAPGTTVPTSNTERPLSPASAAPATSEPPRSAAPDPVVDG